MNNDTINVAVGTTWGVAVWLATLSWLVPLLWAIYIVILIGIKIPELYEKNGLFRRSVDCIVRMSGWWRRGS